MLCKWGGGAKRTGGGETYWGGGGKTYWGGGKTCWGGTNGKDPKIYMQRASILLVYQIEGEKQKKTLDTLLKRLWSDQH